PGRVVELPVLVALAGEHRARVAAAHRDDHVGGPHDLVGPRLRELAPDVDADLRHGCDGGRVHLVAGLRPARPGHRPVAGEMLEPSHRHLRAAGIVHAEEQDVGNGAVAHGSGAASCGTTTASAGMPGNRNTASATASSPPTSWATTNAGALPG